MKKVYISGPISGHDIEERRKEFARVKATLEHNGYEVFNPMENGLGQDASTSDHMKTDIRALIDCDCIYMMQKWNHSAGCQTELLVASACGLTFMFEAFESIPVTFLPTTPIFAEGKAALINKFE